MLTSPGWGIDEENSKGATANQTGEPSALRQAPPGTATNPSPTNVRVPIREPGRSDTNALPKPPENLVVLQGVAKKSHIKGVTLIEQQTSSPDAQYRYAIQITFQAQTNISPFMVFVTTDKPTKMTGRFGCRVTGVIEQERSEPDFVLSSNHWFKLTSPSVTPARPFVVRLLCSTEFQIIRKGLGSESSDDEKSVVLTR
jgi:hypothetical protein